MEGFSGLFAASEPSSIPSAPGPPSVVPTCTGAFVSGKTQTSTPTVPGPPLPIPPPLSSSSSGEDSSRRPAAGPFYILGELPGLSDLTGSVNLILHYNLEHSFSKFCGKKMKEKLSNFLPDLPGMIDTPGAQDNSSLRSLIEKPPICGNSFTPLTGALLTGFRLHTGPRHHQILITERRKRNKEKMTQSEEGRKKIRRKRKVAIVQSILEQGVHKVDCVKTLLLQISLFCI
ncbi:mediator of RNA polymerase II transcription subunit 19 isoform X1 [Xenopus tropicalis]|uniref:Mediator of RNA polymerase II transcription subunit 19 n=1 Tax=Xenopus tropicalis TaxID=8364 RepID=A0A8J1JVJ3_XENTR|nr:mediator of RNA polymerase II transcription subunit 19 isoform X1 [Xenopus tropicalis]